MRNAPSLRTIKTLFAASGGACAFPGCTTRLVQGSSGALLGEMCHIRAASEGGQRYDPTQEDLERSQAENLIILCPTHHSLIDQDPITYTAEALLAMKTHHESRVAVTMNTVELVIGNQQARDFARQVAGESVDFAIIVALRKELEALKYYFPELNHVPVISGSSRSYYVGSIATALGGSYRLVATLLPSIGNLEAAHATADLIRDWNPRFVLVNGIAGGLAQNEQDLGDVVVSDSIVYYELGKVRTAGFERRNRQFLSDRTLVGGMLTLANSEWRRRLPPRPDGKAPSDLVPKIHVGPIASGEKVIAAIEEADRLREGQGNLIAVEMESAGVASAAFSALKKVGFLTVRSICDFADATKDNTWQEYAAASAASCLRAFLETRPVAPSEGDWPTRTASVATPRSADSVALRKRLFDRLCRALDHEEFKNFCFLMGVDMDELPGDRKSSRVRELILLFERNDQMEVLESVVAGIGRNEEPNVDVDMERLTRAKYHVETRLRKRGGHRASFQAIRDEVDETYSDDFLKELIELNPDIFGRCTMKNGNRPGITLLEIGSAAPDYASYTEGIFFNLRWRWVYYPDYSDIKRVSAYCPICDTALASVGEGFSYTQFHCDTCNSDDSFIDRSLGDLEGSVRRQVDQKIRTGRWKQFPNGDHQV